MKTLPATPKNQKRFNAINRNKCPKCGARLVRMPSHSGGSIIFCKEPKCTFESHTTAYY